MATRRDPNIDLINTPMERAQKLYREQLDAAIQTIVPAEKRSNPRDDAMRLVGIRKQDII